MGSASGRDRFDDKACELERCTITDKEKPCPMFGCQRVAKALRKLYAETLMDASWLIWDNVIGGDRDIEAVRACREALEVVAQSAWLGAQCYANRGEKEPAAAERVQVKHRRCGCR